MAAKKSQIFSLSFHKIWVKRDLSNMFIYLLPIALTASDNVGSWQDDIALLLPQYIVKVDVDVSATGPSRLPLLSARRVYGARVRQG
jgi:hypothetical protein